MKLTTSLLTAALFATFVTAKIKTIEAEDASKIYPVGLYLGTRAEGASVNAAGIIHATNGSNIINLKDGKVALKGPGSAAENPTSLLASSRFLQNGDLIAGDAVAKKVYMVQKGGDPSKPLVLLESDKFLQPNDMAVSGCGRFLYFSGMNYTSDSIGGVDGELAWVDLWAPPIARKLNKVSTQDLSKVCRTNGIEVLETGGKEYLYLTSAQNKNFSVISTQIFRFELDKTTGEPYNGIVVLDIAKYLEEHTDGEITQKKLVKDGMDPDGMRGDIKGNLYITLNAYGSVLRWNPETGDGVFVKLKTVAFPTNLELGGPKGDELYVVGKCEGNKQSCIDVVKFREHNVGRAFAYQNMKGGQHRRNGWRRA